MKKVFAVFAAVLMLVAFASVAMAADVTGEVTKYEMNKSITVGAVTATISKDTKVEGVVKVGAKVKMSYEGTAAKEITVEGKKKKAAGGY